jgi:hypothetical protein
VLWSSIAPDPLSRKEPAHFAATKPDAYPPGAWAPYDRIVSAAAAAGMSVDFTVTAPGPLWAMGRKPVSERAANHWTPSALQFYYFMIAIGLRYSGTFHAAPYAATAAIPAVTYWSVWNEPNQPGWLSPQWRRYKHHWAMNSPRLYRQYVDAAYLALALTGHTTATNTILVGELAPEGYTTPGSYVATTPLPFVRALYCVNRHYKPLRGAAAAALGCHKDGDRATFVKDDPLLFSATGFAHHPYYFFHTPAYRTPDPNFAPLANIGRLGHALDRIFATYHVKRKIPFYFTEYGYESNPPDPHRPVTLDQQAAYLNEADYMAWRDPRVRSVAQFLLYDAAPDARYRPSQFKYWDTFQTGLAYANGKPKPSLYAYQIPIWVPQTRVPRGGRVFVWGQVRPADRLDSPQQVAIQWRGQRSQYRTIAHATTAPFTGYLTARVRLPGSGYVKLAWTAPSHVEHSRAVAVSVR